MIGYTTVGTNDLERAAAFYDQLFAGQDFKQMRPNDRICLWIKKGAPMFGIALPYDEEPANPGNGTMIGLQMDSADKVKELYDRAIKLGGSDDGEPGDRGNSFYGAYFRDLDGNKLVIYTFI